MGEQEGLGKPEPGALPAHGMTKGQCVKFTEDGPAPASGP